MNSEEFSKLLSFSSRFCLLLKNSFESLISISTIVLNVLLTISLISAKHCRTSQNLLLVNVCFACIYFSLTCLLSLCSTSYFLSKREIVELQCKFTGFLLLSSCHALMFSYTCVTLVRFLSIIYPFNRKLTSFKSIRIYLISTWVLSFSLSAISLILPGQAIRFQNKARICFVDPSSSVTYIYALTGYFLPIAIISSLNLISYLSVKRSEKLTSASQIKVSRFNRRKRRNIRLLRQFSAFTCIFIVGWTPFILVEIFDKEEKLSDFIYLNTLILPPLCVFIDSCFIFHWNKTVRNQFRSWWNESFISRTQSQRSQRTNNEIQNDMNSTITV